MSSWSHWFWVTQPLLVFLLRHVAGDSLLVQPVQVDGVALQNGIAQNFGVKLSDTSERSFTEVWRRARGGFPVDITTTTERGPHLAGDGAAEEEEGGKANVSVSHSVSRVSVSIGPITHNRPRNIAHDSRLQALVFNGGADLDKSGAKVEIVNNETDKVEEEVTPSSRGKDSKPDEHTQDSDQNDKLQDDNNVEQRDNNQTESSEKEPTPEEEGEISENEEVDSTRQIEEDNEETLETFSSGDVSERLLESELTSRLSQEGLEQIKALARVATSETKQEPVTSKNTTRAGKAITRRPAIIQTEQHDDDVEATVLQNQGPDEEQQPLIPRNTPRNFQDTSRNVFNVQEISTSKTPRLRHHDSAIGDARLQNERKSLVDLLLSNVKNLLDEFRNDDASDDKFTKTTEDIAGYQPNLWEESGGSRDVLVETLDTRVHDKTSTREITNQHKDGIAAITGQRNEPQETTGAGGEMEQIRWNSGDNYFFGNDQEVKEYQPISQPTDTKDKIETKSASSNYKRNLPPNFDKQQAGRPEQQQQLEGSLKKLHETSVTSSASGTTGEQLIETGHDTIGTAAGGKPVGRSFPMVFVEELSRQNMGSENGEYAGNTLANNEKENVGGDKVFVDQARSMPILDSREGFSSRAMTEQHRHTETDYTQTDYTDLDYRQTDYKQMEYTETDYKQTDYTEKDYKQTDYTETDYKQSDYTETDYIETEYIDDLDVSPSEVDFVSSPDNRSVDKTQVRVEVEGAAVRTRLMDVTNVVGLALGTVLFVIIVSVLAGVVFYRSQMSVKPQSLDDISDTSSARYSEQDVFHSISYADCAGIDVTTDTLSEDLYNLDNDSFLNSLEAMAIPEYWTDSVRHTKL